MGDGNTLGKALEQAVRHGDAAKCGRLSDIMRSRGLNYAGQVALVQRVAGCSAARWESLMAEAEWLEGRGL